MMASPAYWSWGMPRFLDHFTGGESSHKTEREAQLEELHALLDTVLSERDLKPSPEPVLYSGLDLQWVVARLEDHYRCALCYETMAAPYSLNNPQCGHTFCALCLVRWALASLSEGGEWHESLLCPMCRAPLPQAGSPDPPRSKCTFPFIPNPIVDADIKDLVSIVREAADSDVVPGSKGKSIAPSGQWHGKVDDKVKAWGQGGRALHDWEDRVSVGREEIGLLIALWPHLDADDFLQLKARLGVE